MWFIVCGSVGYFFLSFFVSFLYSFIQSCKGQFIINDKDQGFVCLILKSVEKIILFRVEELKNI